MVSIVSNVSLEVDNVNKDESSDDVLSSIPKLLSPAMQVRESDLKVSQ